MKRLLPVLVAAAAVLVTAPPAQASTCPAPWVTGQNVVCSTQDGDVLVGTQGNGQWDDFFVLHDNVTVYTEGVGNADRGDTVRVDSVDGTTIHADVFFDGDDDTTNDVLIPAAPNISPNTNTYVMAMYTVGTTFYGSADGDHVDDGNGIDRGGSTGFVYYGNEGNDTLDEHAGSDTVMYGGPGDEVVALIGSTGNIVLDGGGGNDIIYDQYHTLQPTTSAFRMATTSTGKVTIKGGRGKDHLKALRRSDVIYAGKGYDVCRIVKGVETHSCEKVRII
jgi:Ca2+-binding RTX toxin-like protein